MRHRFTIGRFITNEQTKAGLTKVNHQPLLPVEVIFCESNGPVLIHAVKKDPEEEFKKLLTNCWKEWNFV